MAINQAKKDALQEIVNLSKKHSGTITPKQVVKVAEDPDSALHHYFEWDDTEAAQLYRENQARKLIQECQVVFRVNKYEVSVPKFIEDPRKEKGTQGYVETSKLRTDEEFARDALCAEFARVRGALERARKLASFFDLDSEIDSISDHVGLALFKVQQQPIDVQ